MNKTSVYFFNSEVALEAAQKKEEGFLFFYDGTLLENAPSNCINVPIASFYDFFLQTTYAQVSQLNFDSVNFSDEIKSQITQNITQTIQAIKNQKIQIINTLLPSTIDEKNITVMIYTFLKHLIEGADANATVELIIKLLQITHYLQSHEYLPSQQIKVLAHTLKKILDAQEQSMHKIFSTFVLKQFEDKTKYDENREACLEQINDYDTMHDIFTHYQYVKYIYQASEFKLYTNLQAKILFQEDFFELDIIQQKKNIYKFFYATNYAFDFFEDFKEMYKFLHPIYLQAIKLKQDELVMYLYYPLQFSWNGVAQTSEEHKYFNDEVERPLEDYIRDTLTDKYKLKANKRKINSNQKKIKVALLVHRILDLSVNHVMMSLLEAIKKNPDAQYEFIIYDMNVMELMGSEDYKVDELKALGFKYVDLHNKFLDNNYAFYSLMEKMLKVRKLLIKDKIDILIGYHNRAEYNFLFTSRTAPKQVYWSHGNNEYDLDAIDAKISMFNKKDTRFQFFEIPRDIEKYTPEVNMQEVYNIRATYPKESFILGSIGRLVKLDSQEYLQTVAKIMKDNPNTIYLACGSGDNSNIKKKVQALGIADRFYFTGHVDAHLYGHVIDLWLSAFPFTGGEALEEYRYKGKPYVILYDNSHNIKQNEKLDQLIQNIRHSQDEYLLTSLYTQEDLISLDKYGYINAINQQSQSYLTLSFALDPNAYINIANEFIANQSLREKVSKEYLHYMNKREQLDLDNISFFKLLKDIHNEK